MLKLLYYIPLPPLPLQCQDSLQLEPINMAASPKIFTLEGKGLKLTTAEDVEPHIKSLRAMTDVDEIHLQGNTLGIEACKALGEVLETKKSLKVSLLL